MKLNKKWWLIIGFSAVALVGVILVIVLVVLNSQDPPPAEKTKYAITIDSINLEYGTITGISDTGQYTEGDMVTFTFTPNESKCIERIEVDGVNVFDYITNSDINVEEVFTYTFENITSNHTLFVKFDESMTLDSLGYKTRQESGIAEMEYGHLEVWGESTAFPKTGRVRIQVVSEMHYDFHSFILPDSREVSHSSNEDFSYINNTQNELMNYDSSTQSFILSSAFVKLEEFEGYDLELVFVPSTIQLTVYVSNDGNSFVQGYSAEVELYTDYKIDISYMNGYIWYYCKSKDVTKSTFPATIIEKEVEGNSYKYINLSHELYVENRDSKQIILLCVLDNSN